MNSDVTRCACGSRWTGVEVAGVYDGVLYRGCRVCGATRNRWDVATSPRLHALAEKYMPNWRKDDERR